MSGKGGAKNVETIEDKIAAIQKVFEKKSATVRQSYRLVRIEMLVRK
jgi:hypothetical protein